MKSKQLLSVIFLICMLTFLIASCSSTSKSKSPVTIRLLNFDQLESAELKAKGFVNNNLYIGIEFNGYHDCVNNAPAYFASADGKGNPLPVNTLFINRFNPEYVEFMNGQRESSDEPRDCYYETTIPSAFPYLNGSCSGQDFLFTIKVKYDSIGNYLEPGKNFGCEDVVNALKSPNNQLQPIDSADTENTDPCYWKSLIIGSWSPSWVPDTTITYMPDGTIIVKANGKEDRSMKWACSEDGQLQYIYPNSLSGDYPAIYPIKSIDDNSMLMSCWVNYRRKDCELNKVK